MRLSSALVLLSILGTSFALTSCGDAEKEALPVHTYTMGDRITLGHIVYVVYETQWMYQLGEGREARIPKHRFFLIRMSAANGGIGELIVPNVSIVDDTGTTYPEISDGTGVPQFIGYLRRVRPAEAAQGHALFDAPPRHYKLKIASEDGDQTAFVDIPLSFTSESPDVPHAGEPKKK